MPIYNGERYLAEAVESVLNQSFRDFELICINDGSIDRTSEILTGFKDERVNVLMQPNQGTAAARNLGIHNTRGKYVAFIDADDQWLPKKLEVQVPLLENLPEVGAVYSRCLVMDTGGKIFDYYPRVCRSGKGLLRDIFLDDFIPMLTLMVRRSIFDKIGFFKDQLLFAEDYEFKSQLVASEKIACCPEILSKYRKHEGQKISNPDGLKNELEIIEFLSLHYKIPLELRDRRMAQVWRGAAFGLSLKQDWAGARTSLLKAARLQPLSVGIYLRLIGTLPGVRLFIPLLRHTRKAWSRYQTRIWKDVDR